METATTGPPSTRPLREIITDLDDLANEMHGWLRDGRIDEDEITPLRAFYLVFLRRIRELDLIDQSDKAKAKPKNKAPRLGTREALKSNRTGQGASKG